MEVVCWKKIVSLQTKILYSTHYGKNNNSTRRKPNVGKHRRHVNDERHQKAISIMKGVGHITMPRRKRYSAYELSLKDIEEGRVYEAKDVDDLFKQILG